MSKRSRTTFTRSRFEGNVAWYMYTGRGTTSRARDTVRPLRISRCAWACLAGVTRFSVPSWSSCPQRPQLLSSLKYASTRSWVGRMSGMSGSSLSVRDGALPPGDQASERRSVREAVAFRELGRALLHALLDGLSRRHVEAGHLALVADQRGDLLVDRVGDVDDDVRLVGPPVPELADLVRLEAFVRDLHF